MPSMPSKVLAQDTMVRELLRPLFRFLSEPGATEIVINRPGEVYVEVGASWQRFDAPDLTFSQLMALATAIATYTEQEIGPQKPMLSAMLPDGERVQIVLPPAVEVGTLSFSIRRPCPWIKTLDDYVHEEAFSRYVWARSSDLDARMADLDGVERRLVECLDAKRLGDFLHQAVLAKKNIAVVGETGSGKTTLMTSLCQSIPADERLLTIERSEERRVGKECA